MNFIISGSFARLMINTFRFLLLVGGRGSGKSEFTVRKIFFRCETEGGHRVLVLRKVRRSIKETAYKTFKSFLDEQGVHYSENKTDFVITWRSSKNGLMNEVLFAGLDDPEKIKSFKGVTIVWMEEATDFSRMDFIGIDLILREETGRYQQIMMSFNPDLSKAAWIREDFFSSIVPITGPGKMDDSYIHHSTVLDNPIKAVRQRYIKRLLAIQDPTLRKISLLGIWAAQEGQIFNWPVVPLPKMSFDQIFYGGDFGYSDDEAAAVKIYRRSHTYWVELLVYETGLTDPALGRRLKVEPRFDCRAASYWDSEDPKAIQTMRDLRINALKAVKGPGSVKVQIDQLRDFEIFVVENELSHIFEMEQRYFKYKKDREGRVMTETIGIYDHAISAARYGIYTNFDLYLRPSYKTGRVHRKPEKGEEVEETEKAILTTRKIKPKLEGETDGEKGQTPKEKKGGFGYGSKKGRIAAY